DAPASGDCQFILYDPDVFCLPASALRLVDPRGLHRGRAGTYPLGDRPGSWQPLTAGVRGGFVPAADSDLGCDSDSAGGASAAGQQGGWHSADSRPAAKIDDLYRGSDVLSGAGSGLDGGRHAPEQTSLP